LRLAAPSRVAALVARGVLVVLMVCLMVMMAVMARFMRKRLRESSGGK
jgi:hypothetical protein